MDLINQTGVPTELVISEHGETEAGASKRAGVLVAKATYEVRRDGTLELVTEDPHPVLRNEEETALGILPRDVVPPGGQGFEVLALAAAYAPGASPVNERTVTMWVEETRDDLLVIGDREWLSVEGETAMTPPAPFTRIPLTWDRAFGGTALAWFDEHTQIPFPHSYNPLGRGFDPSPQVQGLGLSLRCSESYPRTEYHRTLPNIEHPTDRITVPEDEPTPCCWAPMPMELGLRLKPAVEAGLAVDEAEAAEAAIAAAPKGLTFAGPRWRMPRAPTPLAPIGLTGCLPQNRPFAFRWPRLTVCADYVLGDRTGVRELVPRMLVLLPEEGRFTVTYRDAFSFLLEEDGLERSVRLRLEE